MAEGRILPGFGFTPDTKDIHEAIGVALGAASVAWEPMDCTGVFRSQYVGRIVDELTAMVVQFACVYRVTHNDETMQKVYRALKGTGMPDQKVVDTVMAMQNAGILFREAS